MLLSDLFVAGIDGVSAQARVRLLPGANGITPAPPMLGRLLEELFYAQGFDGLSPFSGKDVRAGCVLFDDASVAYRLMRDVGKGSAQLAKAEGGQYVAVSDRSADVAALLRSQLRLPSREAFSSLFALSIDDMPSRAKKATSPVVAPAPVAIDAGALKRELETLRRQQTTRAPMRAQELELDALQKKKYALDDLARKRKQISDKLYALEQTIAQGRALDALPKGFADLAGNFDQVRAKFTLDKQKLTGELERLDERGAPPMPEPLYRNVQFLAGTGIGLALLAGAMFLDGDARLIGLVDIAPLGWAALQALTFVEELEASERYRNVRHRLADRLNKIEAKFERETQTVRQAMQQLDVETPEALIGMVHTRNAHNAERDRLHAQLTAFDAGEGRALQADDPAVIEARMMQLEDELAASTVGNDAAEVSRRITEIEMLLTRESVPVPPPPVVAQTTAAPFLRLVQALGELTGQPLETLASALAQKTGAIAQQALGLAGALTLDELGRATWQGRPWATLAPPLQDNVFVVARLAAFEMVAASVRFPLFLLGLDALAHVVPYAQMLPLLASVIAQAQVVMVAGESSALAGCPNVVSLA